MAFSTQRTTSDGTLALLDISIEYFDRSEIAVLFNGVVDAYPWAWVGSTESKISFSPAVPNTVEVMLVRTTDLSQVRHMFTLGAQFTTESLDEDLVQILHIAQEAKENATIEEVFHNLNMHGYRVVGIGNGVDAQDVPSMSQLTTHDTQILLYRDQAASSATNAAASAAASAASAASALHPWVVNGTTISYLDGFVGIDTTPVYSLDVNGPNMAIGYKLPVAGYGGLIRYRIDTGMELWGVGVLGGVGTTEFSIYNLQSATSYLTCSHSTGNVGIGNTAAATAAIRKLVVAGGHTDTRLQLYSEGDGATQDASLDLWASEPATSYTGAGVGSNVNGSVGSGKRRVETAGGFINFTPSGDITFSTSIPGNGGFNQALQLGTLGQISPNFQGYGVLGEVLTSGGTGGPAVWRAKYLYTTAISPIPSAGSVISIAHGLSSTPLDVVVEMTCLSTDGGYAIGDVVQNPMVFNGASSIVPLPIWRNGTRVGFTLPTGHVLATLHKASGSAFVPTLSAWSYRFRIVMGS